MQTGEISLFSCAPRLSERDLRPQSGPMPAQRSQEHFSHYTQAFCVP
jgi:hypothetical protein